MNEIHEESVEVVYVKNIKININSNNKMLIKYT